jgi:DNA-binding NtrC family response regulator
MDAYRNLYRELFIQWQRGLIVNVLETTGGNQCKAAEILGIHRNTFTRMTIGCGLTDEEIESLRKPQRYRTKTGASLDIAGENP